jgi:hypothetical protein
VKLIEEEDESLLKLIADRTESLCGYKPDLDSISEFLKSVNSYTIPPQSLKNTTQKIEIKKTINSPEYSPENKFTLEKLDEMAIGNVKPNKIEINGQTKDVKDWTELSVFFVKYLIQKGYINRNNVPILNSAQRDKYFINIGKKHMNPAKDGAWQEIDGYYVDTKYSASRHIKNMLHTLKYLNIKNLSILISLREI